MYITHAYVHTRTVKIIYQYYKRTKYYFPLSIIIVMCSANMPVKELTPKAKQQPSDVVQSRAISRVEGSTLCRANGDRNDIILERSEHTSSSIHRTESENAKTTHSVWGPTLKSRQDFVEMHFS